jgi:SAM-dependent methyltransferase
MSKNELTLKEKYDYYESSVQNPKQELKTLLKMHRHLSKETPRVLREDFCGTGYLACEWVKLSPENKSYGIDLDLEPINIGKERHYSRLNKEQKTRMQYIQADVTKGISKDADIIVAFNFSYFIFKTRSQLLKYFKSVRKGLKKDGVFYIDLFGGPDSYKVLEEMRELDGYNYYWDCQKFDALTNECLFAIHFKPDGRKKMKNVFTYDWRMWGIAELKDILTDAGFKTVQSFWEGEDGKGEGNGIFKPTNHAEQCEAWVTYLAAKR